MGAEDFAGVQTTIDGILRVVRHMSVLSPEAREKLVMKFGISEGAIADRLRTYGSKLNPKLNDPEKIIDGMLQIAKQVVEIGTTIPWLRFTTGKLRAWIPHTFTAEEKALFGLAPDEPVGTLSLIPITPELRSKITKELRGHTDVMDRMLVNVAKVPPPPSDQMILILRKENESTLPEVRGIYTGIIAPALPNPIEQGPEELHYNIAWWEQHVFVGG